MLLVAGMVVTRTVEVTWLRLSLQVAGTAIGSVLLARLFRRVLREDQ